MIAEEDRARYYYESHVTIEPVFGERLDLLRSVCSWYEFRVASLIMRRSEEDAGEVSRDDTFCSGRSEYYEDITWRTVELCRSLKELGFKVLRAKVEDTVWDTRMADLYGVLG